MMKSPHYPALLCAVFILQPCPGLAAGSFSHAQLEVRQKLQSVQNIDFSAEQSTLWLQRWLPTLELGINSASSLLIEPVIAADSPHSTESSPLEQSAPDLHRLILSSALGNWQLQAGRQVWAFGNQRQLGKREGTNIRRRFDGLLLSHQQGSQQWSLYRGLHVIASPGDWDDRSSANWQVSGLVLQSEWMPTQPLRLHYLRYQDSRGNQQEFRQSLELNLQLRRDQHSLELEHIYQWGHQQQSDIAAHWSFIRYQQQLNAAYSWSAAVSQAAGDNQPQDQRLTRFEPLFAKAPFYSEAGIIATSNINNLQLAMQHHFSNGLQLELEYQYLARQSANDHLYGQGRSVLLPAGNSERLKVADVFTVRLNQQISAELEFELLYSQLVASQSLAQVSANRRSSFFEAGFTLHY